MNVKVLLWWLATGLRCAQSRSLNIETFHKLSRDRCDTFHGKANFLVRTEAECMSTCIGDCVGVRFDPETQNCLVLSCQIAKNSSFSTLGSCYLSGDEHCSETVTSVAIDLSQIQSSTTFAQKDNCLSVPINKKTVLGMDLGSRYMISSVVMKTRNIKKAKVVYKAGIYFPTDPAIESLQYRIPCKKSNVTGVLSNDELITVADCNPCPIFGQYVILEIIGESLDGGNAYLCNVNVTGCLTEII